MRISSLKRGCRDVFSLKNFVQRNSYVFPSDSGLLTNDQELPENRDEIDRYNTAAHLNLLCGFHHYILKGAIGKVENSTGHETKTIRAVKFSRILK